MKIFFIICLAFSTNLWSQQIPLDSKKWIDESLNAKNVDSKELSTDFTKYNFCPLWLNKQESIIGFIDDNFERFYIRFLKITKYDSIPFLYNVKGKTRVNNNICDFSGEIKILNIRETDKLERGKLLELAKKDNDIERIKRHQYQKFVILSEYTFREDSKQKGSGIFKGIMKSYFYIKDNSIIYDDLDLEYRDSYSNNQCVGTWKSYKSGVEKKCNWGDYRIPYCGDLDGGAGEFSPNVKYLKNGWQSYYDAYFKNNSEARKEEEKKWW